MDPNFAIYTFIYTPIVIVNFVVLSVVFFKRKDRKPKKTPVVSGDLYWYGGSIKFYDLVKRHRYLRGIHFRTDGFGTSNWDWPQKLGEAQASLNNPKHTKGVYAKCFFLWVTGDGYFWLRNYDMASRYYSLAIQDFLSRQESSPLPVEIHDALNHNYAEARSVLKNAEEANVNSKSYWADTLYNERKFADALPICEDLIRSRGTSNDYARKGQSLWALNRYREAAEAYKKALQLCPESNSQNYKDISHCIYRTLEDEANFLCREGRYAEALPFCDEVIQLNGWSSDFSRKAGCLYKLNRYQEALAAYQQALEHCGKSMWQERESLSYRIADTLEKLGEREKAENIRKARHMLPPDGTILSGSGPHVIERPVGVWPSQYPPNAPGPYPYVNPSEKFQRPTHHGFPFT